MKTLKDSLVFLTVLVLSGIPAALSGQGGLTGTWLFSSYEGEMKMQIDAKTLTIDDESYSYRLQDNVIMIDEGYAITSYPFLLEDDQLALQFPDGTWILFTRVSGSVPAGQDLQRQAMEKQPTAQGLVWQLNGVLCSWSGSSNDYSSYSRTRRLAFDGQGNFQFGSEASFSSDAGLAYSGDPNVERGTYTVNETNVTLYYPSGEKYIFEINIRQDNGMITELMYGETLYASGLCE
jgi:hypothetical protein